MEEPWRMRCGCVVGSEMIDRMDDDDDGMATDLA